jgi:hypothetical protein
MKQCAEPRLAAGILPPQKFVLLNGRVQDRFIIEAPPHFFQQLRDRNHAGIGLLGSGRFEINPAIGVDHAIVVGAGEFLRGPGF